jgi:hypothetical protein
VGCLNGDQALEGMSLVVTVVFTKILGSTKCHAPEQPMDAFADAQGVILVFALDGGCLVRPKAPFLPESVGHCVSETVVKQLAGSKHMPPFVNARPRPPWCAALPAGAGAGRGGPAAGHGLPAAGDGAHPPPAQAAPHRPLLRHPDGGRGGAGARGDAQPSAGAGQGHRQQAAAGGAGQDASQPQHQVSAIQGLWGAAAVLAAIYWWPLHAGTGCHADRSGIVGHRRSICSLLSRGLDPSWGPVHGCQAMPTAPRSVCHAFPGSECQPSIEHEPI